MTSFNNTSNELPFFRKANVESYSIQDQLDGNKELQIIDDYNKVPLDDITLDTPYINHMAHIPGIVNFNTPISNVPNYTSVYSPSKDILHPSLSNYDGVFTEPFDILNNLLIKINKVEKSEIQIIKKKDKNFKTTTVCNNYKNGSLFIAIGVKMAYSYLQSNIQQLICKYISIKNLHTLVSCKNRKYLASVIANILHYESLKNNLITADKPTIEQIKNIAKFFNLGIQIKCIGRNSSKKGFYLLTPTALENKTINIFRYKKEFIAYKKENKEEMNHVYVTYSTTRCEESQKSPPCCGTGNVQYLSHHTG